jgi:hypothetical protein
MRILPSCNTKGLRWRRRAATNPVDHCAPDSSLTLACGASMIDVASRRPPVPPSVGRGDPLCSAALRVSA